VNSMAAPAGYNQYDAVGGKMEFAFNAGTDPEPTGYTVSGAVTSYNATSAPQVKLVQGSMEAYDVPRNINDARTLIAAVKNKEVEKIILTRPAVEAGEKLGFLPGDMNEKVDPYLRPLFDALQEMMGQDAYLRHIERGSIEIAPLAYMRGRTLSNSFIILDEAQNTTREQMKMFLTRMGENSRIVVTGDVTQIDLPKNVKSGMIDAIEVLDGVEGIDIVKLTAKDVVRHELVTRIIQAYEKAESARAKVATDDKNCD